MLKKIGLGLLVIFALVEPASAEVVAIGTSFTQGYGVGSAAAYPTLLEAALQQKGYNVTVRNAGVFNDTAQGGLARVGSAVPDGTKVAIVEFGVNELHGHNGNVADLGPALHGIANNLHSRGIKTIFVSLFGAAKYGGSAFGPVVAMPKGEVDLSTRHPNANAHRAVAQQLVPLVAASLRK